MSKITAADVNKLRKQTGAGMMDCKKALVEAEGDFEKAIEILRKKGQKVAAKRGDRDAAEGLALAASTDGGDRGAILVLNCETDFVAKNEDFGNLARTILNVGISTNAGSVDELMAASFDGNGLSVGDKITEQIGTIGEKIEISMFERIEAPSVVAYNHPGNQVASLVGMSAGSDAASSLGREVAMQVAAMAPVGLNQDDVPQSVIEKEIEIGKEMAINEGKPAEMAEKIAKGKLNKFFKENTLLNQMFIKDNKKSVAQYLNEQEKDLTVTSFKRGALS